MSNKRPQNRKRSARWLQRGVRRLVHFFAGGGFGGGFVGATFPVEPIARKGSCGLDVAGVGLVGLGMNYDSFRTKVWEAYFLSDYQVRYWKSFEIWVQWSDRLVRGVLAFGAVIAAGAFMADAKYMWFSTLIAVICGLIATVVIPVLGLDGYVEKIVGLRNRWIDVRNGYQDIWDELDEGNFEKLKKSFEKWVKIDTELEQMYLLVPTIDKLRNRAFAESEKFLCVA